MFTNWKKISASSSNRNNVLFSLNTITVNFDYINRYIESLTCKMIETHIGL